MRPADGSYPESYGAWAGYPAGHKPDLARCCVEVTGGGRWPLYHQCLRSRGFGPQGAYCKQHDPDVVAKRRAENDRIATEKWNKERARFYGATFLKALQQIADGHNDARGLAQEVIADFKKGEHK